MRGCHPVGRRRPYAGRREVFLSISVWVGLTGRRRCKIDLARAHELYALDWDGRQKNLQEFRWIVHQSQPKAIDKRRISRLGRGLAAEIPGVCAPFDEVSLQLDGSSIVKALLKSSQYHQIDCYPCITDVEHVVGVVPLLGEGATRGG